MDKDKDKINMDIIEEAENAIKMNFDKNGKPRITTSQIRKLLSAINKIRNKVEYYGAVSHNTQELSDELAGEIKFLKVTLAYMCGRDKQDSKNQDVKDFVEKSNLSAHISGVGKDTAKFYELCKYVEALVAYHKFYGGKDK